MEYKYLYSKDLELPELHRAAKIGDRAKVKRLLAGKKAKPDERGNYKDTPLMWAAVGGSRDIVADLLKAGADVKAIDDNKSTPLLHAAENGRDEIVADLLAAGANVKTADMLGMNALHLAALADSPVSIATLIANGIAKNNKNGYGHTALHLAAILKHPAAVRALVKGGVDANIKAKHDGFTALHFAAMEGALISAVALIDHRVKLDAEDKERNTAMHKAAQGGHLDIVDALIDAGATVNPPNAKNQTPLLLAQQAGHTNVADMLIDADINIKSAKPPEGRHNIAKNVYDGAWRQIVLIRRYPDGRGSGVIVAPNLVATNFHVVRHEDIGIFKAQEFSAVGLPFRNKAQERRIDINTEYSAQMVVGDPELDFCLLKVPGLGGKDIKVRASHTLRVGEEVYAIGNPNSEDLTLSAGVISQLRNNGWKNCREIQTNAAISPGSSGGGLFDKDGNLIGITTSGFGRKEGAENLNFAIPADLIWAYFPNFPKQKPARKGKKGGKR